VLHLTGAALLVLRGTNVSRGGGRVSSRLGWSWWAAGWSATRRATSASSVRVGRVLCWEAHPLDRGRRPGVLRQPDPSSRRADWTGSKAGPPSMNALGKGRITGSVQIPSPRL